MLYCNYSIIFTFLSCSSCLFIHSSHNLVIWHYALCSIFYHIHCKQSAFKLSRLHSTTCILEILPWKYYCLKYKANNVTPCLENVHSFSSTKVILNFFSFFMTLIHYLLGDFYLPLSYYFFFFSVFYFLNFKIFNSYMRSQTWTPLPLPSP